MKHMGCVLLALSLSGCVLLGVGSKNEDGEHCDEAADCESENCMGNICIGTSCSSSLDCPDDFNCYHYDGDPIFGLGDHYACRLTCDAQGACPAQWKCYEGDMYCSYVGPSVTVSVSNTQPRAHEVVSFTATIDPPVSDVTWTWDFYSLGKKTGSSFDMTFTAGDWDWSVDGTTPNGGEHYENGRIHVCAIADEHCTPYSGDCCSGLSCNASTSLCE